MDGAGSVNWPRLCCFQCTPDLVKKLLAVHMFLTAVYYTFLPLSGAIKVADPESDSSDGTGKAVISVYAPTGEMDLPMELVDVVIGIIVGMGIGISFPIIGFFGVWQGNRCKYIFGIVGSIIGAVGYLMQLNRVQPLYMVIFLVMLVAFFIFETVVLIRFLLSPWNRVAGGKEPERSNEKNV